MANVLGGAGCTIAQESATPGTYTTIAEVVSISPPKISVGSVETTHLSSSRKTFRPTIMDGGEVSFEIHYDPDETTHSALTTLATATAANQAAKNWRITFTDATPATYTFSAFVTGFEVGQVGVEENITATITMKVSGAVTIA